MTKKYSTIDDCKIIELENFKSERKGNLTPVYSNVHIPFDIKRIYYLYDIPSGVDRGGHAHKELEQLMVAVSGSFNVVLNDGEIEKTFVLNRPFLGLYIPKMIWRRLTDFSGGSICLVLASNKYDSNDYLHDFDSFSIYRQSIINNKV